MTSQKANRVTPQTHRGWAGTETTQIAEATGPSVLELGSLAAGAAKCLRGPGRRADSLRPCRVPCAGGCRPDRVERQAGGRRTEQKEAVWAARPGLGPRVRHALHWARQTAVQPVAGRAGVRGENAPGLAVRWPRGPGMVCADRPRGAAVHGPLQLVGYGTPSAHCCPRPRPCRQAVAPPAPPTPLPPRTFLSLAAPVPERMASIKACLASTRLLRGPELELDVVRGAGGAGAAGGG